MAGLDGRGPRRAPSLVQSPRFECPIHPTGPSFSSKPDVAVPAGRGGPLQATTHTRSVHCIDDHLLAALDPAADLPLVADLDQISSASARPGTRRVGSSGLGRAGSRRS